jgi:hypothetical protein
MWHTLSSKHTWHDEIMVSLSKVVFDTEVLYVSDVQDFERLQIHPAPHQHGAFLVRVAMQAGHSSGYHPNSVPQLVVHRALQPGFQQLQKLKI